MSQTNQLFPTCRISFTSAKKKTKITVLDSDCVQSDPPDVSLATATTTPTPSHHASPIGIQYQGSPAEVVVVSTVASPIISAYGHDYNMAKENYTLAITSNDPHRQYQMILSTMTTKKDPDFSGTMKDPDFSRTMKNPPI
jgi:hypothetical protein